MSRTVFALAVTALLLGACGQQKMYEWGNYQDGLYAYYQSPEKVEELMKALDNVIVSPEESKRVPPGIYAEYGYLLMIRNKKNEAVTYFEKEKTAFPESAVLMDRMIDLAVGRDRKKVAGTDSAPERTKK